jgi:hypothetical protein
VNKAKSINNTGSPKSRVNGRNTNFNLNKCRNREVWRNKIRRGFLEHEVQYLNHMERNVEKKRRDMRLKN